MQELKIPATIDNLGQVLSFIETITEENEIAMQESMAVQIATEEVFVNIANYAYGDGEGEALIQVDITQSEIKLVFVDSGIPYNPLQKTDPDITLSMENRAIGGLGIYMIKESMDEVSYRYEDEKNILTLIKRFSA